jgi:hypothetical protein
MITIQKSGFRSKSLFADVSLGIFEGLDNAMWCYAFATVIFAGALAQFLPLLVVILLCGWAFLGICRPHVRNTYIVSMDEQAVVILTSIAGLLVLYMGAGHHAAGLSPCWRSWRCRRRQSRCFLGDQAFRLTRLELMPYPVFAAMAGIGWLLLRPASASSSTRPCPSSGRRSRSPTPFRNC